MKKNKILLKNGKIYTPNIVIENGYMTIDSDGKVTAIGSNEELQSTENVEFVIDLEGKQLLPGFIDVHIHGGNGDSFMDGSIESIENITKYHAKHGTTSLLATTTTSSKDKILKAIEEIVKAKSIGVDGADIIGIHLEGPFINEKRSGAQDKKTVLAPDIEILNEFIAAAAGTMRLVTLAPEVEHGIELVKYLVENKITVSAGHSDASYNETVMAVKEGVSHTTHHFNGMRPIHHRDPGLAGAGILLSKLTTELIADGIHVHPEMIKLLFQMKGSRNVCLITDAVFCAGLQDGEYEKVTVKNGEVYLNDSSTLAGSSLTTIKAFKNVIQFTGMSVEDILPSLTQVPARQAGVEHIKGSLEVGKDADFLILDENLDLVSTYVRGNKI